MHVGHQSLVDSGWLLIEKMTEYHLPWNSFLIEGGGGEHQFTISINFQDYEAAIANRLSQLIGTKNL